MKTSNVKSFYIGLFISASLFAQSVVVSIGDATVSGYTADIEVPVTITNPNNEVSGLQFDMAVYPEDVVSLTGIDTEGAASGFTASFNELSNDFYRIVLYNGGGSSTIPANSSTIMTLHFNGSNVVSSQQDLFMSGLIVSNASGGTISSLGNSGSITIGYVVSMSMTNAEGDVNESVSLSVNLDNGGTVGGVQFDLYDTPDYVTITGISTTTRTNGFNVSSSTVGNGTRILIYDDGGNNISAGTGAILNLNVLIHNNAYAGDVALTFKEVVVTDDIGGIYWIAGLDTGFVNVYPGYMEEPHNLVAASGLDGMVPLSWVAPYGPVGSNVEEDFEEGALPEGWTMTTNSAVGWFVTQNGSSTYWDVPAHTWYACSNDDAADDDGSVDYLITPPLNTNGASDFQLNFASFYDGAYSQTAHILVSTDGVNFNEVYSLSPNTAWVNETVDLNAYVNEPSLYIVFHSNDNGAWASGWAVDDILISFTGGRYSRNIHYDFNELGQWVITADKAQVVERFPNGLSYVQKVDWEHPNEIQNINRDIPVSGYNIYRTTDGINYDMITSVSAGMLTYTDIDVTNGETYYYYVTADYSPDGTESQPSNLAQATPVEWIELEVSGGIALSGNLDTLDIFINNESDVSFFYFEIADYPNVIQAQDILSTSRTSNWSLDVSEVSGQMVITGLGLGNNIAPGNGAVCKIVVLASSLDPVVANMEITNASILDEWGNNMIWTAESTTFEVTVETQYIVMPMSYANPGEMVTIPLVFSNTKDVYGIQIYLNDNMNYLNGIAVLGTTTYHDFSDWTVQGNDVGGEFRILLFNNSFDNPIPRGSGHIADIFMQMSSSATVGSFTTVQMEEMVVVDENSIPMHVEMFESKVYAGTPAAIYSISSVDQSAKTFTVALQNTSPVYVVELDLSDMPDGIEIDDVTPTGRFDGSVDGQSGEMLNGNGYVLAYDLSSGISVGSGNILEVSYHEKANTGIVTDLITWISGANSADANLNSISSSCVGFEIIDANLSTQDEIFIPKNLALHPAYPNPFNPVTHIQYDIPEAGFMALKIFDLSGREVKTLFQGFATAGRHTVVWDAKDNHGQNISAGVYIYRLESAGEIRNNKLIYLK